MSDYLKKTDDELNEAIFKIRFPNGVEIITPFGDYWASSAKYDYTHDWRLAGELLEEMKCDTYFYDDPETGEQLWMVEKNACWQSDLKRAICEAWLAWKGQG